MESDKNSYDALGKKLLEIVYSPNYHPKKPKTLMRLLNLDPEDRPMLRKIIKKLVAGGQLSFGANHLVRPGELPLNESSQPADASEPRPEPREKRKKEKTKESRYEDSAKEISRETPLENPGHWIIGSFRRSASGVGFVRPRETDAQDEPMPDIYIAAYLTRDAMTGDIVAVEVFGKKNSEKDTKKTAKMREHEEQKRKLLDRKRKGPHGSLREERGPRGRVVQIIERVSQRFVGTYFEEGDWAYVQVDGNIFNQPIEVGDPSANNAQINDKVVIEMLRYPTQYRSGEAVLTEVLGPHGQPGLDTMLIIREYQLPEQFSETTLRAARDQVVTFFDALPDETESYDEAVRRFLDSVERTDLTGELIITIDPEDAKDFDDAISLERLENGHWNLGVHIADVSHFVEAGSPIDAEAKDRATSVYLPDRVIPMLPEVLSNSLASLQPHKVRFTLSVYMEFTDEGIRCNTEIVKSAIRSAARFNYEQVQQFVDLAKETGSYENAQAKLSDNPLFSPKACGLLDRMYALAMILRGRRKERGALEMNMPDVKIDLDADGKVIGAHAEVQSESHQIIEEFMLSANEAVAEFLAHKQIPFLRRVHKNPTYRKIKHFADFLRQMKLEDLSADALLESRFLIQEVLEKVAGQPEETAVDFSLLRAMQRAVYTPDEEGHYALASLCYTHFTSPIRRYPDLTVHRVLKECISGRKPKVDLAELHLLGLHCSERERRAEDAERELNKLKLIDYMSRNIGMEMDAVVSGLGVSGIFVLGLEIPAEGLIPIASLTDDVYKFDRDTRTISGRRRGKVFRLGEKLRVQVTRADLDDRVIDFQWIKEDE